MNKDKKRVQELEEKLAKLSQERKYGLNWESHPEENEHCNYSCKRLESLDINKENGVLNHKIIEGDNLLALRELQKTHKGKVDVIYIDPPYNTGKEFTYLDQFKKGGEKTGEYRWLNFMRKRLRLAKNLLSEQGVIFVSIDDNEQAYLKLVMDEVFGSRNFISNFIWLYSNNTVKNGELKFLSANLGQFRNVREYIMAYSKNKKRVKLGKRKSTTPSFIKSRITNKGNKVSRLTLKAGIRCEADTLSSTTRYIGGEVEKIKITKGKLEVRGGRLLSDLEIEGEFRNPKVINSLLEGEKVIDNKGQEFKEVFLSKTGTPYTLKEKKGELFPNVLSGFGGSSTGLKELRNILGVESFDYPKPVDLIKEILMIGGVGDKKEATILDFFAGSGTTGQAVMELNEEDKGGRQFILSTNNEVSEGRIINHLFNKGVISKSNKSEFRKFKEGNNHYMTEFKQTGEFQQLGIARSVTQPRIKKVIEGYTTPSGERKAGKKRNMVEYYKVTSFNSND